MSGRCCNEYGCKRAAPILVRRTGLTRRWVVLTRYTEKGNGIVSASQKHDVHDDLMEYLLREGWTPPADELTASAEPVEEGT